MRTIAVAVTLVLTLGLVLSFAQSTDEAAVKKLNEDYAAAIKKADVKAVTALHTEDAVRATRGGISVGHAQIEKALTEQYAGRDPDWTLDITIHDVKLLTQDVAIVHGAYKTNAGKGHFIRTLVKKDGSWKIAAIQIAADPSEPSS